MDLKLKNQAIKVRTAINQVILTLMDKNYKLDDGGQTLNSVMNGITYICKRLFPYSDKPDSRIIDFIVYQLYRRRDCRYRFTAVDLFSCRAADKYEYQFIGPNAKPGMNYYIDLWLQGGGLTRAKLTKMIEDKKPTQISQYVYIASEETIKRRFFNTPGGYMLCQNSTTGYAPRSEACRECDFKEHCCEQTERKYPELMRLRTQEYKNYGEKK